MNNTLRALLLTLLVVSTGLVAMPQTWKEKVPVPAVRDFLLSRTLHYGLDLAGGSQLDFKVDMTRVDEKIAAGEDINKDEIVNGVKATLQRRIDPDGTRELNIFSSDFNGEKHIFVELTADIDTPETRKKLAKHIDLQFMRQKEGTSEADLKPAKDAAEKALSLVQEGKDFATAALEINDAQSTQYTANVNMDQKSFRDQLPAAAKDILWNAPAGELISKVLKTDNGYSFDGQKLVPINGFSIFRVGKKEMVERTKKIPGEDFETVAQEVSTDSVTKKAVDDLSPALKEKVLTLLKPNEPTKPVEFEGKNYIFKAIGTGDTDHLQVQQIVLNTKEEAQSAYDRVLTKEEKTTEEQLSYDEIFVMATPNPWEPTGLDGEYFRIAKVSQDRLGMPVTSIEFTDDGAKKFEALTEELVGKPMAIFVGGDFISAPTIQEKISGGSAQISFGSSSYAEAQKEAYLLARDLNAGAIPAPVSLDGEMKVAASLGSNALQKSIVAGLIGLALLSVWLIISYRLLGVFAVFALAIYAIILLFILKITPIFVLTLAGIAGMILSIGMAVDANVLIFERMREELRSGKNFSTSLAIGFERAWTSIRDANLTTLIVCGILYTLGTSIVKGFATMLAIGVLLSMFTAVTITRSLLKFLVGTEVSRNKNVITKL